MYIVDYKTLKPCLDSAAARKACFAVYPQVMPAAVIKPDHLQYSDAQYNFRARFDVMYHAFFAHLYASHSVRFLSRMYAIHAQGCRVQKNPGFLPRDASAERGDATVSRLSVCPSVTFRYQQNIGWNSSKIISRPNSLRPLLWLTPNMGDLVQREHPQNSG